MRVLLYFLAGVGAVLTLSLAVPSVSASSITCANVRCAGGTCVDTPTGPVCQPQRLTCANMLCPQGKVCKETSSGPVCQPKKYPPIEPPATPPYQGSSDGCKLVKHYSYGQAYYRRVCSPKPVVQPGYYNHHYYPRRPRRHPYGYGYNHHYPRYGYPRYYPPRRPYTPPAPTPTPAPNPDPGNGMVCTQQYAPVCAQKQVQCFRAPCPPVKQTFSNSCMASAQGYSVLYNGTCR